MSRLLVICLVINLNLFNQSLAANLDLCNDIPDQNVTEYDGFNTTENCGCEDAIKCPRKCCRPGYYLRGETCYRHKNSNFTFHLNIYNKDVLEKEVGFSENFSIGVMDCQYYRIKPDINPVDTFYIQNDGQMWIPGFNQFYNNSQYCVDNSNNSREAIHAFLCFEDFPEAQLGMKFNTIGMAISMPFLLATFIVYTLLPKRNLHMKALMFYVISLFLGYVFLVYIQQDANIHDDLCVTIGFIILFFFILSFFWMNVICIDIWRTFSGRLGFEARNKTDEKKRLFTYCIYSWGMSAVLILMVFLINHLSDPDAWYYPGVGDGQCFLKNNTPQLLYFYIPMGILITANIILFILTAVKIREAKKDTKILDKDDSQRHYENKKKFNLYLKLLLAMGINWTLEFVSFVIDWQLNLNAKVWYIPDFCNAVYGVFIFFLFVFKKKIWNLLKNRFNLVGEGSKTLSTKTGSS